MLLQIQSVKRLMKSNIETSIKEHHHLDAVPSSLVEHYNTLIESKRFSVDPVVIDLREPTSTLYNKVNYTLEDGSVVSIDESTRDIMRNLFFNKYNEVSYMNESKENFLKIIQLII